MPCLIQNIGHVTDRDCEGMSKRRNSELRPGELQLAMFAMRIPVLVGNMQ